MKYEDYVPKTDLDKARYNRDRYQFAKRQNHDKFIRHHDRCDDFFFSNQWEEADKNKLAAEGRPALTINRIKPIIRDATGEFLANRADIKFVPSAAGTPEVADALTKLYIHVSNEQDLPNKESILWLDGVISSRAYYDVRIGFDDNLMGEVQVNVPNPKSVIPDPDSDSADPADWNEVLIVTYHTLQDIELRYGEDKAKKVKKAEAAIDEEDRGDSISKDTFGRTDFATVDYDSSGKAMRRYRVIERQYRTIEKKDHFVNLVTGDIRRVPPSWDDEEIAAVLEMYGGEVEVRKETAQLVRWTVSCGSVLLHDDESPYAAFTIIPWFPIFRRGKSAGLVEDLIDPQMNYNKQRSQELHIVNGTANAGWKVRRGGLTNMTLDELGQRGAKTGLVIEYAEDPGDVERIQPVNIPQGLDRVSEKAGRDLESISGIDEESRGVARGQTPGKAIQARREASLVSMGMIFESMSFTRKLLARRILDLLQRFYSEERHIRIVGNSIRGEVEDIVINQPQEDGSIKNDITLGEYGVIVTPAPQRDSYEQAQFDQLKEMQTELGIKIPGHLFIEFSDLGRKPEIMEEIKKANGFQEPSEEQVELERMMQELEMEEKKASIAARMAQAQLSQARAQKVLSEIENAGNDPEKLEKLFLEAQKLDMEREHNEESMDIRRRAQALKEAQTLAGHQLEERRFDADLEQRRQEAQAPASAPERETQPQAAGEARWI